MGPLEITGTARLVLGLATGIAFGFILQKGQALKFHKIIDALRLKDFTIWKLMFTAIGAAIWFLDRIDRGARKKEQASQLAPSPLKA
jgi:prolipoprotein diacylglyceryltransferase